MSLFKKLPFDAEVDIREKALNHCRAMFVKDLDLQQVIEYMAPDDNCLQDNLGLGQSTKEEQIARFLNYLNTRNEKSFSLFMDFLNENHKHLFTLVEETIRSFGNCYSVHGNQDEMQMTGERLQHLLKKREKNPIHLAPTDHLIGSEDLKTNPDEQRYISCHSMAARGHQDKEKRVTRVTGQTDAEKDKTLSMSVVILDSVFRKISLSDARVPDLVRRPPKQCEVYVYDDEQGRNAEKKAVDLTTAHRTKHVDAVSSSNFINNQHNETKKYIGSCGTVQVPPPVPPKPSHLPLMGFDVGMSFAQKTSVSELKFLAGNLKRQEIVKNSSSDLLAHTVLPTASGHANKKPEKSPSASKETGAESLTLTGYRSLHDREIGMPRGDALLETVQRQTQESDLKMNDECSLDYNVSIDSASDLGFEEKNVVGEDKKKIWKTDEASESFPAAVENTAMPTYSSVDLERKNSRFRVTTDGERQPPRIEVFVNDVDEIVGNKVDEMAKIPEKSPVGLLPGETFPAPETVELRTMVTETEHHLKMCDMADPPLPAKQISLCELPDDEDDTSSDNSYYEDIDVLSQTASGLSKGATNGEIYLDPKTKERTSGKWRGLIPSDYRSSAPPYKIIPKGYLVLVENIGSCQELSHTKSDQSSDDGSHTSPIESCIKISCSDVTSASRSNRDEETEMTRETASKPGLVISQCPDILCETSTTNSQDILHYFYNTRLAYDKDGHAFYVPIHLLKKYGDPDGEPWFYPLSMTARQAALFLMAEKLEGCFVVYQPLPQSPDAIHNLSVCLESGDVVHYHIIENALGDIRIEGHDHSFTTLAELIDYFSKNKSSLATRLRRPLKYAHLPVTPGFHYDIKYELERTELSLTGNIIGQGYFGVVCSGMYRNLPVAVKVLQQTDGMLSNEDDFLEEAKSLMGLRHEHVVRLVGVSCKARPFFIVTEFASNGSVKDCLRNGKLRSDHVEELYKICVQMVSAMSYLEAKHFMLHRDLASRNFLMANESCVKLADFGRARLVTDDCYQAPRKERICIKWASPEVLIHSRYSSKSDVWAVGVVFWELFSWGERPYAFLPGEQTAVYVAEGGRLDRPSDCPPDLYQVMRNCWKENPQRRPTFAQLHEQIKVKSCAYSEHSFQPPKRPNSLAVGGVNQLVTPSSSKPTTPSSAKFRLTYPAAKKSDKFTLQRETSDDRRNSLEPKLLVYRNRGGTSSSETSIASGNGFLDLERGEEDLSRGDRIRRSLRNLMKIKTKGRPGARLDVPGVKRCQDTL